MEKDAAKAAPKTGMARLMELAMTKKPLIIGAMALSALASVVSFVPYLCIYAIVREVLYTWPTLAGLDVALVVRYGWLAFGGAVANILLYFAALMCSHLAAFGTLYELKIDFATHLARIPLGVHQLMGSGKLRKIMDENIEKIEGFIAHQLPDLVASLVAPVTMVVILLAIDWRLGLAAIVGVVLAFCIQMKAYGNQGAKQMMAEYQATLEDMNNASVEYVRGMPVVKAFRQTVQSFARLRDTIKRYTGVVIPYTLSWQNYMSAFTTAVNNLYLFVLPVGILLLMGSADPMQFAPKLIFYLLFLPASASVLMKVMYVTESGIQILSGVEAMDGVLARPALAEGNGTVPEEYTVEFKNVGFRYEGSEGAAALRGVSFVASQGAITAIVGPSGGGKSTIAHLIPRFFDVAEGQILIGGRDIRDMKTRELMEKVSFVFQDVFLFKQSVRENIRLGNPGASDIEIEAAAKAAQCHDFIMALPKGYETVIGTKGVHLSGGEQQRLAIARAIVKDAPIIVLDEATAFADPENEHLIQKAFEKLMKDKTVVMIAHRLSTVQGAGEIIVVEDGHIVEEGVHNVLSTAGGRYQSMWETYTDTVRWTMAGEEEKEGGEQSA